MARGPHRQKPKPHPADVPKRTGKRLVDKHEHWYSAKHLQLVRSQACLVSRSYLEVVAHHPDECFPRLVAASRKIPDFLAVPLRHDLHDPGHPGSVHKVNNARWWRERHVNVYAFLRGFLRRHYPVGHPSLELALTMITEAEEGAMTS